MTKQPPPYAAILPTILCQQPAVILHWLKTERATGNLPVEVVLDCIIEVLSRQNPNVLHFDGTTYARSVTTSPTVEEQLEVYKRAVKAMRTDLYMDCPCDTCVEIYAALTAVDKPEGK